MSKPPLRIAPWSGHAEWKYVANLVEKAINHHDSNNYDDDDDDDSNSHARNNNHTNREDVDQALYWLTIWMMRGDVPPAVESTFNLLCILRDLLILENSTDEGESIHLTRTRSIQLALATSVIRFVNEIVDPEQQGEYAKPVSVLAERRDIPRVLVDLRHTATHDTLPGLEVLMLGMRAMFRWLRNHYWEPMNNVEQVIQKKILSVVENFVDALKTYDPSTKSLSDIAAKCLNSIHYLDSSPSIQKIFIRTCLKSVYSLDRICPLISTLAQQDPHVLVLLVEYLLGEPPHLHGLALLTEVLRLNLVGPAPTIALKASLQSNSPLAEPIIDLLLTLSKSSIPSDLWELATTIRSTKLPNSLLYDNAYLVSEAEGFLECHLPPVEGPSPGSCGYFPSNWKPMPFGCTETFNPITDYLAWESLTNNLVMTKK